MAKARQRYCEQCAMYGEPKVRAAELRSGHTLCGACAKTWDVTEVHLGARKSPRPEPSESSRLGNHETLQSTN